MRFAHFLRKDLPPPPEVCYWHRGIKDWGMMGNNRYGNCVIATAAHMILAFRANELKDLRRIADQAVIDLSREMGALNGYNILDRLRYWRKSGMWSNHIWAYTAIHLTNHAHIKTAIDELGAVDLGVNLPSAWQGADSWTCGAGRSYSPGSWGGHSVPLLGYDNQSVYAASWGEIFPMTWNALDAYCDEAYAVINPDWFAADALSPSQFDLNALHAALCDIGADDLGTFKPSSNAI